MANYNGVVKWFNVEKGYGFINKEDDNVDIFVHYSQIQLKGYKELFEGDLVTFEMIETVNGYQAINVKRTKCNLVNLQKAKKMANSKCTSQAKVDSL